MVIYISLSSSVGRRPHVTVQLRRMGAHGLEQHMLLEYADLNAQSGEQDPWVLLAALYGALRDAKPA